MTSPRVITSEQLQKVISDAALFGKIEPNSIHIIDHSVIVRGSTAVCHILCRFRDSDEAHIIVVEMLKSDYDALPTADEFARELERANETN